MLYEIRLPQAGFSITEGVIVEWNKRIGELVQKDETIVTVETDKVLVEIPAQITGVLTQVFFRKGESAPVGAVLGTLAEQGDAAALAASTAAKAAGGDGAAAVAVSGSAHASGPSGAAAVAQEGVPAGRFITPVARKMAEEEGIDLSVIRVGSGPGGRIVKIDVLRFLQDRKSSQAPAPQPPAEAAVPEKIKFVGWRKVIADRMVSSAREVPQGRTLMEVDFTELADLLASLKKKKQEPKITFLPFLIKAIQAGIEVTPEVNAYCYEDGFVLQQDFNAGIAVEVGEKLVVPVIKKVRDKSIQELAGEVQELARKAREERLKQEDVQGGTMTITNLGPFDVYAAVPLILQPQTTIVAMGSVRDQPWVSNGAIEMRKKAIVTGVFDHRCVNGAPGARFLKKVKDCLEDLSDLLLWLR